MSTLFLIIFNLFSNYLLPLYASLNCVNCLLISVYCIHVISSLNYQYAELLSRQIIITLILNIFNPPKSATSNGPKQAYLKPSPYFITSSISSIDTTPFLTRSRASLNTANCNNYIINVHYTSSIFQTKQSGAYRTTPYLKCYNYKFNNLLY